MSRSCVEGGARSPASSPGVGMILPISSLRLSECGTIQATAPRRGPVATVGHHWPSHMSTTVAGVARSSSVPSKNSALVERKVYG